LPCQFIFDDDEADSLSYSVQTPYSWLSYNAGIVSINKTPSTPVQVYTIVVRAAFLRKLMTDYSSEYISVLFVEETFTI